MPGTVAEGPTVSLSFANNFWGKDDAGVGPMLERMHNAKVTCDELKAFYNVRAAIEDEYARKLMSLCRKPLGSCESGSLRSSLDIVRGETEAIAKSHSAIAAQMKRELEEPLAAFAGGMKERRKIVQNGIERILKTKMQQTATVNKTRDRFEQDCLRIKGYLAQGHMVMGQEERKNKAKLEKTQIQLASNSTEYETAVKILEETTGRWNKEWKSACDKFQDLEEERLDFTKSSLWSYANIASTVCVSDDASCEKIRLSLENCEVEKDISSFIKEKGTGQEIPDPPKYINFCRGDVNDSSSEISEEEGYSVAQFQRTINPAFRSSSPQPSTYESHHDPQSELAAQMGHPAPATPSSREATVTPQKPAPQQHVPPQPVPQQPALQQQAPQQPPQQPAPLDLRRSGQNLPPNYHPDQHGEIGTVPHNAYPTDGMTMFCRTGPPSERSSGTSAYRPSSRDSQSDVSNPTSFSSQEPPSARQSPTKPTNGVALPGMTPEKQVQKKRSAFFSNSPFRRKSRHDKERQSISVQPTRGTWDSSSRQNSPTKSGAPAPTPVVADVEHGSGSPEPVDPRASFQLNVGNNVFDVASPDNTMKKGAQASKAAEEETDPIARALADLKVAGGKQSANRVSADRYHGITTPIPSAANSSYGSGATATPPPAYNDTSAKRLDAPQPAFTSAQMQKTTQKYVGQTHNMLRGTNNASRMAATGGGPSQEVPRSRSPAAPRARSPAAVPRARSPAPASVPRARSPAARRSASPQPALRTDTRMSQYSGGAPSPTSYQSNSMNSRYAQSPTAAASPVKRANERGYSPQTYSRHGSPNNNVQRAVSPQPQFRQQARPSSAGGMELQLSSNQVDPYGAGYDPYGSRGRNGGRPMSSYYGDTGSQGTRSRSKSLAVAEPGRQYSRDGRPILQFARAMYSYTAVIPEELGFLKGDILAVIRMQDDGWWEAEVTNSRGRPGLVPSNYLQGI